MCSWESLIFGVVQSLMYCRWHGRGFQKIGPVAGWILALFRGIGSAGSLRVLLFEVLELSVSNKIKKLNFMYRVSQQG